MCYLNHSVGFSISERSIVRCLSLFCTTPNTFIVFIFTVNYVMSSLLEVMQSLDTWVLERTVLAMVAYFSISALSKRSYRILCYIVTPFLKGSLPPSFCILPSTTFSSTGASIGNAVCISPIIFFRRLRQLLAYLCFKEQLTQSTYILRHIPIRSLYLVECFHPSVEIVSKRSSQL